MKKKYRHQSIASQSTDTTIDQPAEESSTKEVKYKATSIISLKDVPIVRLKDVSDGYGTVLHVYC